MTHETYMCDCGEQHKVRFSAPTGLRLRTPFVACPRRKTYVTLAYEDLVAFDPQAQAAINAAADRLRPVLGMIGGAAIPD